MADRIGIVMLNMGGPENLAEVRPFLYRLFSDPAIINLRQPMRAIVATLISQLRAPKSRRMYKAIGGRSPLGQWTALQARQVQSLFDASRVCVQFGMNLSQPFIKDCLISLKNWGATRLVMFPLFPQYANATTGSCFAEVRRTLKGLRWSPETSFINSWCDNDAYLALGRRYLEQARVAAQVETEDCRIIFVAHGLPMKTIERGDPYAGEVLKTVNGLAQELRMPWSIAYQSRTGPVAWMKPYLDEEIARLGSEGVKNLIVMPVSFVSDHVETLHEIDQQSLKIARRSGVEGFFRVPMFNGDPEFSQIIKSIIDQRVKV